MFVLIVHIWYVLIVDEELLLAIVHFRCALCVEKYKTKFHNFFHYL